MVQVVVMQGIVWNTVLLFLFEFRAARILVTEKFRGTAASIASFKLESDVVSLDDPDVLETESEIGDDGMLYVTLRKANSTRRSPGPRSCSIPNTGINQRPQSQSQPQQHIISQNKEKHNAMESHVLVGSSGVSPMPESEGPHAFGGADFDVWEQSGLSDHGAMKIRKVLAGDPHNGENKDLATQLTLVLLSQHDITSPSYPRGSHSLAIGNVSYDHSRCAHTCRHLMDRAHPINAIINGAFKARLLSAGHDD
ncbi:protein that induces appearance of [PIN+] prion when overproduced [Sarracenia purpurea var. burkii]